MPNRTSGPKRLSKYPSDGVALRDPERRHAEGHETEEEDRSSTDSTDESRRDARAREDQTGHRQERESRFDGAEVKVALEVLADEEEDAVHDRGHEHHREVRRSA